MENLVIIGSGPAGLTAAIYAARSNINPLVLSGIQPGGQLTATTEVENYPGFPEGINGFELMEKFRKQAERFGARFRSAALTACELRQDAAAPHRLSLDDGSTLAARALIVATGAAARWLGLESEERLKNRGVSACATCDGAFFRGVRIAVVGGGDTALEEALFLTRFAADVVLIHRRDQFRGSKVMQERVLHHPKIKVAWNRVVAEVLGTEQVEGVLLKDVASGGTERLECGALFVAIGHEPNTAVFRGQLPLDEAGYIRLPGPGAATGLPGVYAAGDCADRVYRQAITAAGMGCQAAIEAERWLAETASPVHHQG
ncbi:MAG: thioredoxin-disulfide reductase [Lentisphaeria bacterium]|jgi:thioredoxin reductase (NADPH)